ncbi:hypothetical protein EVAR_19816_1 [Eumeta japonica]|uniref:Mitochondria-eating protein n=1 Tax=Eumeta variegata TaxID=151549 RepID=A0A4C1USI9_EUMVA|nr:hypothetical protein EVAR_19816_1 [Eumeta japonica]
MAAKRLSFRAVIGLKERRLCEIRTLLGIDPQAEGAPAVARLSAAAVRVLQDTAHTYPLGEAERTVVNQVLSTLREYPCLGTCAALHSLVSSACRVAWLLSVHTPPLRIDTDFTPVVLNPERHVRYSRGSEQQKRSDLIRSFVWPALLDGDSCVFRAVVIT